MTCLAKEGNAEEWRAVFQFEGVYEVSSLGRVRRLATGFILNPTVTSRGYAIVNLVDASRGLRRCSHVYNLVTRSFLGPKPSGMCVNHIDGDKTNNTLVNLEYVTYGENSRHAVVTGLVERKLRPEQIQSIREMQGRLGSRGVAQIFGVGRSLVLSIWAGKSYSDVPLAF